MSCRRARAGVTSIPDKKGFETESPLAPRALLTFSVDYTMPNGEPVRMKCEASIVRIEGLPGGRIGVGAEILGFSIVRPPGSNEPS